MRRVGSESSRRQCVCRPAVSGYFVLVYTSEGRTPRWQTKILVEGKLKQAEGKAQDAAGDVTGNTSDDDVDGKAKQVEGKAQELFGKAKEAIHDATK